MNARVYLNHFQIQPCAAKENSKHSLNYQVAQFNSGITLFNLDSARMDSEFLQSEICKKDMVIHEYGAVFYKNKYRLTHVDVKIGDQFDALLFFPHSTPTQLIRKKKK